MHRIVRAQEEERVARHFFSMKATNRWERTGVGRESGNSVGGWPSGSFADQEISAASTLLNTAERRTNTRVPNKK